MSDMISILMKRDDLTCYEVEGQINEFKVMLQSGELGYDLEEAFMGEFSLEPDYILDIF